jgi:hypothetical protein
MATLDDNDLRIWDRFIDVNMNEKLIHDQPIKFVRPEILEYTPSETSHPIKLIILFRTDCVRIFCLGIELAIILDFFMNMH